MTPLNIDAVAKNIKDGIQEKWETQKSWWCNGFPYVIGASLLRAASALISKFPADVVVSMTSHTFNFSSYVCTMIGKWNTWKALQKEQPTLQGRKIEYIQVSKEELARLQNEIKLLNEFRMLTMQNEDTSSTFNLINTSPKIKEVERLQGAIKLLRKRTLTTEKDPKDSSCQPVQGLTPQEDKIVKLQAEINLLRDLVALKRASGLLTL